LYTTPPKPGETITYVTTTTNNGLDGEINGEEVPYISFYIEENVGKKYTLPMPMDGSIVEYCDNHGNFLGYFLYFKDANGIEQRLSFGPGVGPDINPTFLQNIPKVTGQDKNADQEGITLKRGTPLLITGGSSNTIFYGVPSTNGENGEVVSFISMDIKPLTITDASGQTKIPRIGQ
jgi:hypothetical protein